MTIEAACPCGARFHAESHLAGQVVACPSCGQAFQVPKPEPPLIQVQCHCGKSYRVKGVLAGKKVQCAACGQSFVAQAISGNVVRTPTAPAAGVNPFGPSPGGVSGGGLDVGGLDMGGMGMGGMGVPADPLGGFGAPPGGFGAPAGGFAPAMGAPAYAPQPAYPQPAPQTYGQPYGGAKRSMSGPSGKTLLWIGGGIGGVTVLAVVVVLGVMFLPDLMSGLLGGGKSSPEAAFAAFQSAAQAEDYAKIYDILAPKERDRLLARLALITSITSRSDPEAAEVLNKHGINREEILPASGASTPLATLGGQEDLAKVETYIASKTSPRRLFNDLAVMARRKTSARGNDRFSDQLLKNGTLGNVTVTGEQATGSIHFSQNGLNRDGQVRFIRHEGSWYVSISAL
jgi:hypothetical protein